MGGIIWELGMRFGLAMVGAAMFIGGLCGIMGSFRTAHPFCGLGSVIMAFLGFALFVVGLFVAGHQNLVGIFFQWIDWLSSEKGLTICLVTGVVLAALVRKNEG